MDVTFARRATERTWIERTVRGPTDSPQVHPHAQAPERRALGTGVPGLAFIRARLAVVPVYPESHTHSVTPRAWLYRHSIPFGADCASRCGRNVQDDRSVRDTHAIDHDSEGAMSRDKVGADKQMPPGGAEKPLEQETDPGYGGLFIVAGRG